MAHFVLENNYLQFSGDVKKQISGKAIGTSLHVFICGWSWNQIFTILITATFIMV